MSRLLAGDDGTEFNYDASGRIKLAFGTGHIDMHKQGYINVDIRSFPHIDVQCDLSKKLPLKDDYADEILAHSLLEHFPMGDYDNIARPYANTIRILKEWIRVLKPEGVLILKVPNIKGLASCYLNNKIEIFEFFNYLYGGQDYPENTHLAGFDTKTMQFCLHIAGFSHIDFKHAHNDDGNFDELSDWEMRVVAEK